MLVAPTPPPMYRRTDKQLADAWGCTSCRGCIWQLALWTFVAILLLVLASYETWLVALVIIVGLLLWIVWPLGRH